MRGARSPSAVNRSCDRAAGRAADSRGPARTRPFRESHDSLPSRAVSAAPRRSAPARGRTLLREHDDRSRASSAPMRRRRCGCRKAGSRNTPRTPAPMFSRRCPRCELRARARSSTRAAQRADFRRARRPCGFRNACRRRSRCASNAFNRTMRAEGRPSAVAVASVIALNIGNCACTASSNQARNCAIGSAATSPSSRRSRMYSCLRWAMSMCRITE